MPPASPPSHPGPATDDERWSDTLRRRGAVVLSAFSILWVLVAASGLSGVAGVLLRIGGIVVACALIAAARRHRTARVRLRRQAPGWRQRVGLVNAAQLVAIAVVVVAALTAGAPQLVAPLVAIVVGLHFVPLAPAFDEPGYRATAVGLGVAGVLGLLLLLLGPGADDEDTQAASRLATGAVATATLWGTALRLVRGS